MSNTGATGSLDHDRFVRAMLQLRNTPDPDCNLSPAQIIFGRPLRDTLSFVNRLEKFSNPNVLPLWRQAWAAKEEALRTRITRTTESLQAHSRPLRPLTFGERVFLQNQRGSNPTKWDRSGVVLECLGHDQYRVKVDGSGRLTLRNRRFLRAYKPATPSIQQESAAWDQATARANQLPSRSSAPPTKLVTQHAPAIPRVPVMEDPPLPLTEAATPVDDPSPMPSVSPETAQPTGSPMATDVRVAEPQSPRQLEQSPRPRRVRRPPKRFEPKLASGWNIEFAHLSLS